MKKLSFGLLILFMSTLVTAADKPAIATVPPIAKKIHTDNTINGGHLVDDYR